jgi:hypothetical protein
MNYATFKKRMTVIHDFLDSQKRVAEFIHQELAPDDHKPCVTFGEPILTAYIEMLGEAIGDDGTWIDYWLWETDRGRRKTAGWTHESLNGRLQPMKTLKDLWNAIHYPVIKE